MKLNIFHVVFVVFIGSVFFTMESFAEMPQKNHSLVEKDTQEKLEKVVRELATCWSYFGLAFNSHRRDKRLDVWEMHEAGKVVDWAVRMLIKSKRHTWEKFFTVQNDIEDAMYLKIDRETRKIGILIDEYGVRCQLLVDRINRTKKSLNLK